jgi:hypothetical protein
MQAATQVEREPETEAEALARLERELEQGGAPEPAAGARPCWSDTFAASGGKTPVW